MITNFYLSNTFNIRHIFFLLTSQLKIPIAEDKFSLVCKKVIFFLSITQYVEIVIKFFKNILLFIVINYIKFN